VDDGDTGSNRAVTDLERTFTLDESGKTNFNTARSRARTGEVGLVGVVMTRFAFFKVNLKEQQQVAAGRTAL